MPLPLQALLGCFVLLALTLRPLWLFATAASLVWVMVDGFRSLWGPPGQR
jgi:hypothetical protein